MQIKGIRDYEVSEEEICKIMEDTNSSQQRIKVQILKLMPLIKSDTAKEGYASIESSMLINDSSCKPYVKPSVQTQNYLSVNKFRNSTISKRQKGTFYLCKIINQNLFDIYLTDRTLGISQINGEDVPDTPSPDIYTEVKELVDEMNNLKRYFDNAIAEELFVGKSAYQSYVDTTTDNPPLDESAWASSRLDMLDKVNVLELLVNGSSPDGKKILLNSTNTEIDPSLGNLLSLSDLNTDDIPIHSTDDMLAIRGKDISITDETDVVRFQTGIDNESKFYFFIRDINNNVLINSNGITDLAIPDNFITNRMLSDSINLSKVVFGNDKTLGEVITELSEETYTIEIIPSNGGVFVDNSITLTAVLYNSKGVVVTDHFTDDNFIWTRNSDKPADDIMWNNSHSQGTKNLIITRDDLYKQSRFRCSFQITTT